MYTVAALIGVMFYRQAGFHMPVLEKIAGVKLPPDSPKPRLLQAAVIGAALAVIIIAGDYLFYRLGSPLSLFESDLPAWWRGILAAFSAAVSEEILTRLFLVTILTLLLNRLVRLPQPMAVWSAIVLSSLVFGILHLPATANLVELTAVVVTRAILLNGIGGIAFGWLYWKRGLEAAMVAHFFADAVIHGLAQLII